jgi:hypothetical protein
MLAFRSDLPQKPPETVIARIDPELKAQQRVALLVFHRPTIPAAATSINAKLIRIDVFK